MADYSIGERQAGYTRVVITADSETIWAAGQEGGAELAFENPSGTMTMANNILYALNGYSYQPYSASDALLDPSAELGDGVTVASIYSVIAQTNITFDPLMGADLAAPNGGEITSEYPYLSPIQRAVEAAQEAAQDAYDTALDAYTIADEAADDASTANALIQGFQTPYSSVKIDGNNLVAGTVTASELQGGVISLIDNSNPPQTCGSMTLNGASSATYAVGLTSGAALSLSASSGAVNISNPNYYLQVGLTGNSTKGNFFPNSDLSYDCGTSSFRWNAVYNRTSACSTSDRNLKKEITYDLDQYEEFYNDLKPTPYRFNLPTSDRVHTGFISQDVEENLEQHGMTALDFGGFCKDPKLNEQGEAIPDKFNYSLRYEEFIALNTWQIQKLKAENAELKERLSALEAKING